MKTRKRIISWFVTFSMLLTLTPSYAAAAETEKPYRADDVYVMQGQEGFTRENLMDDIEYDSAKYELALEDDGGFDIDTPGEYEVRYSLTSKATAPEFSFEIDEPDADEVSYILTGSLLRRGSRLRRHCSPYPWRRYLRQRPSRYCRP